MPKPAVLVAIPAYRCERQIGRVLAGFDKPLLSRVQQVLVIDNQSPDGTVRAALQAAKQIGSPKIKVVSNKENVSLGGSHKVAFLYGQKLGVDYVAILHGDDQAETQELNRLLDLAEQQPAAGAILGSRFMKGSALRGYNWQRIAGNRALNLLFSVVMGRRVSDLGSGLNLFKLSALNERQFINFGDDLGFNFDLLLYLLKTKAKIVFTPITWKEEDQVSNARNLRIARLAVTRLLRWRFGLSPKNPSGRTADSYVFTEHKRA